jgi:glutamate/aspartate transport system substrate-binding protein
MKTQQKLLCALIPLALAMSQAQAQSSDTLKKIKETGAVTMGVRESSGLSFTIGNGVYTGFHVDVCQKVLADIKKQLALPKLDINYVPVTSQNRISLVQNGTVDLECGSTTNNATRQKDVAFALTTFVEEGRIAVKADSGITNITQLAGKTVATTTGSTSVKILRQYEKATGVDFKELYGKDHADSFLLLESGRADAFIMDSSIVASNIAKSKKPADFKILSDVVYVEPIGIMLRKDDAEFKKSVDASLKTMMAAGEMNKLWDKWFLKPVPPANVVIGLPLSEGAKAAWANPNDKPAEDYAAKK